MALSIGGTAVIAYAIKAAIGLRASAEDEEAGLDGVDHGEAGYHEGEGGGHGGLPHVALPSLESVGMPSGALDATPALVNVRDAG
jgi:hypothetical protein